MEPKTKEPLNIRFPPIADIAAVVTIQLMLAAMDPRYEVVQGFNDDVFAELWDKTQAPAGLAILLRRSPRV